MVLDLVEMDISQLWTGPACETARIHHAHLFHHRLNVQWLVQQHVTQHSCTSLRCCKHRHCCRSKGRGVHGTGQPSAQEDEAILQEARQLMQPTVPGEALLLLRSCASMLIKQGSC